MLLNFVCLVPPPKTVWRVGSLESNQDSFCLGQEMSNLIPVLIVRSNFFLVVICQQFQGSMTLWWNGTTQRSGWFLHVISSFLSSNLGSDGIDLMGKSLLNIIKEKSFPLCLTFMCAKLLSVLQFCLTLCNKHPGLHIAQQAPLSMEFSRQEYWSGLPFPSSGNLPDAGIKPASPAAPALQVDSLPLSHLGSPYVLQP